MLEDLIIETESIDTTNLSDEEKVIIDCIESTEIIEFHLERNEIYFYDKDDILRNFWQLKNDTFIYSHKKIYDILEEKFGYNEQEINNLVKDILLNYYKIKVTTETWN